MKKLIKFNNAKGIQGLADKKYGGNFSLAVNSVMGLALESEDFCDDINKAESPISGDLGHKDIVEFANYIKSEHAKLGNLPARLLDAAMVGIDASLINERVKRLVNSDGVESARFASKDIFNAPSLTSNCSYIKTAAELASVWVTSNGNERKSHSSEAYYHNYIVENFSACFPAYNFVNNEVVTSDGADRIDILAKCKETNRDVIIELKVGSKSAHKQLRSYAYEFENPVLINISELEVNNKRDGITYLTYKDVGVELDCHG